MLSPVSICLLDYFDLIRKVDSLKELNGFRTFEKVPAVSEKEWCCAGGVLCRGLVGS